MSKKRRKDQRLECIAYVSVEAELSRVEKLESKQERYIREYAKEIGSYHLTLNVWACNPSAMKFYEKQGMQMLKKEMEILL